MTLLNAPEFDEKKETRRRSLLIGSAVTVLAIAVIAFAGFALGHGWMFMNLPAEHRVSTFLAAVEARAGSELKILAGRPAWPWQDDMLAVLLHKSNVQYELHGWSPK